MDTQGKVYIVGGGPGDPELLTLKAKRIIESADVVIFADSLVPPQIVEFAKDGAQVIGSSELNLDQIMELELNAVKEGKVVARIQSGDPSIYGAILEQMRILDDAGVEFEIIPGVSAAFAAAAVLKSEFTVPEKSQTVIMTRMEGRVAMPEGEQLKDLAAHGCTMVIFLSITRMTKVVRELTSSGYTEDTPVAVVYRVGWSDELIIRGTLKDIAAKVRAAKITLQALIIVGDAVDPGLDRGGAVSHLYSADYTHRYRKAVSGNGKS
ncbi:MAG TPA: precorrin-4 C(11)-methyltransferase [Dehalococcoidia bacterium]|nr:precorrin-4 C(11)-methyltransferase [Dehalococcoidia bacterium]HIL30293.1 precorrin-4 C(11)-methyltransferase [Dehalococcoidia bacterium]